MVLFFLWPCEPCPPHSWGLSITQQCTTFCRPPLAYWSARRRDLYLTTHNTRNRQTFMPPAGFEPTISAGGLTVWFVVCVFTNAYSWTILNWLSTHHPFYKIHFNIILASTTWSMKICYSFTQFTAKFRVGIS
jgi:hypothetical protein